MFFLFQESLEHLFDEADISSIESILSSNPLHLSELTDMTLGNSFPDSLPQMFGEEDVLYSTASTANPAYPEQNLPQLSSLPTCPTTRENIQQQFNEIALRASQRQNLLNLPEPQNQNISSVPIAQKQNILTFPLQTMKKIPMLSQQNQTGQNLNSLTKYQIQNGAAVPKTIISCCSPLPPNVPSPQIVSGPNIATMVKRNCNNISTRKSMISTIPKTLKPKINSINTEYKQCTSNQNNTVKFAPYKRGLTVQNTVSGSIIESSLKENIRYSSSVVRNTVKLENEVPPRPSFQMNTPAHQTYNVNATQSHIVNQNSAINNQMIKEELNENVGAFSVNSEDMECSEITFPEADFKKLSEIIEQPNSASTAQNPLYRSPFYKHSTTELNSYYNTPSSSRNSYAASPDRGINSPLLTSGLCEPVNCQCKSAQCLSGQNTSGNKSYIPTPEEALELHFNFLVNPNEAIPYKVRGENRTPETQSVINCKMHFPTISVSKVDPVVASRAAVVCSPVHFYDENKFASMEYTPYSSPHYQNVLESIVGPSPASSLVTDDSGIYTKCQNSPLSELDEKPKLPMFDGGSVNETQHSMFGPSLVDNNPQHSLIEENLTVPTYGLVLPVDLLNISEINSEMRPDSDSHNDHSYSFSLSSDSSSSSSSPNYSQNLDCSQLSKRKSFRSRRPGFKSCRGYNPESVSTPPTTVTAAPQTTENVMSTIPNSNFAKGENYFKYVLIFSFVFVCLNFIHFVQRFVKGCVHLDFFLFI